MLKYTMRAIYILLFVLAAFCIKAESSSSNSCSCHNNIFSHILDEMEQRETSGRPPEQTASQKRENQQALNTLWGICTSQYGKIDSEEKEEKVKKAIQDEIDTLENNLGKSEAYNVVYKLFEDKANL